MPVIRINEIKTVRNRPFTISLSGFIGQSSFRGFLEGVNLVINDTPYYSLTEEQKEMFEEKVHELIPVPYDGKYKQRELNKILKNGSLEIRL